MNLYAATKVGAYYGSERFPLKSFLFIFPVYLFTPYRIQFKTSIVDLYGIFMMQFLSIVFYQVTDCEGKNVI